MAFLHPILTPITGRPTYQILAAIHLKINANAASVFLNHGDGMHGLLALSVTLMIHFTTTCIVFAPPIKLGLHTTNLIVESKSAKIAHATREHNEFCKEWQKYIAYNIALRNQLLNNILKLYLKIVLSCVTR